MMSERGTVVSGGPEDIGTLRVFLENHYTGVSLEDLTGQGCFSPIAIGIGIELSSVICGGKNINNLLDFMVKMLLANHGSHGI